MTIVGAERWRSEALMFAGADLRRAPVEFFAGSTGGIDAACAWLTARRTSEHGEYCDDSR